jgi:protein TonB
MPEDVLLDAALDIALETPLELPVEGPSEVSKEAPIAATKGRQPVAKKPTVIGASTANATSRVVGARYQVAAEPLATARPDHAYSPKPAYPLALRDLGVSGVVWLRVWVDKTGRPQEIELSKGSGYRLFDEAALRAVQQWRFIPAKNEQQSLASWVEFAVRFEING